MFTRRFLYLFLIFFFMLIPLPTYGLLHPQAIEWLARLNRLLPATCRTQCEEYANSLPLDAGIEEVKNGPMKIKASEFPEETLELYIGLKLLQRKEALYKVNEQNLLINKRAQEILQKYRNDLKKRLRRATNKKEPKPQVLPERHQVTTNENDLGVDVLRFLPNLQPSWGERTIKFYLKAAEEDLQLLKEREESLKNEYKSLREHTSPLKQYLYSLSKKQAKTIDTY